MQGLAGKALRLALVLFLATVVAGMMSEFLPGDPVKVIAPFASDEQRLEISQEYGFDKPFPSRYAQWVGDFVTGDLGFTYSGPTSKDSVADKVGSALPVSLLLMLYAQILALLLAVPLGVWSAYRAGTGTDKAISTTTFGFAAVPNFVLAFFLSYVFAVRLGWVEPAGYTPLSEDPVEHFRNMILPSLSLALPLVAVYMRLLRADMITTLQQDFVLMARSKGLSPNRILWRHALRPSSITLVTSAGINVGALIGGGLIIEYLFNVPGMGKEIQTAIGARQYPALQSLVAVVVIVYVVVNLFLDLAYRMIDPRIRHG